MPVTGHQIPAVESSKLAGLSICVDTMEFIGTLNVYQRFEITQV